ncbi:MAG: hypothetical protein K5636_00015, partial [Bacteroidales bacterium]|nr:hypothetical protein [Bacteroidales bacterium]
NYLIDDVMDTTVAVPASKCIEQVYGNDNKDNRFGMSAIKYPHVFIPIDADKAVKAGVVPENQRDMAVESINLNLQNMGSGLTSSQLMSLDIINSSIIDGWKRPCYFAMTVPESYYLGLTPYLRNTGMAYQVTPLYGLGSERDIQSATDKMYDIVMNKFRWGGIDVAKPGELYLDETVRRMVTTIRSAMVTLANDLIHEGQTALIAADNGNNSFLGKDPKQFAQDRFTRARKVLDLILAKLPTDNAPYSIQMGERIAMAYADLETYAGDKSAKDIAIKLLEKEILRFGSYARFYQTLSAVDYDRLTRYDRYIDQYYLPLLITEYKTLNEKGTEALGNKLSDMGVDLERTFGFLSQQTKKTSQPIVLQEASDSTTK